jgi:hypothetical protein
MVRLSDVSIEIAIDDGSIRSHLDNLAKVNAAGRTRGLGVA